MKSSVGMSGDLATRKLRASAPHKARSVRIPGLGRVIVTRDKGESTLFSTEVMSTNLCAFHRDGDGKLVHEYDLGSGLVTNVGVQAMANDFNWGQNFQTLKLSNNHATGTGTTAAAATDIKLQTPSTNGGQTPVAGTQTFVSAANTQKYQTVATISYTGSEAVTEWGLITDTVLSATTGSPATAVTSTQLTATGTPYTASTSSVRGQTQKIVVTGTTASYALICANSTSAFFLIGNGSAANTSGQAWYKTADGTNGTTPGNTETFTIYPVMWDHKVFSAINVVNGDSIQFTYSLTINSGG